MARGKGAGFRIVVIGDTAGATRNFKSLGGELERLGGRATGIGPKIGVMSGKLKNFGSSARNAGRKMTFGLTLPILAMGGAATKAASEQNEAMNKVNEVFGRSATEVLKWSKTTADSIGQSSRQALAAAGTFGNLFTALKLPEKQARKMSMRVVELASDLSSFNDMPVDESLTALRSGLSGETEPLKRFGVLLNDAMLKQKALDMGLIKSTTGTLPPAIRTQAAYALILEQTQKAQGDFARTSDEAANATRRATAKFEDQKAALGQKLLPHYRKLITFASGLLDKFNNLSPGTQDLIIKIAGLAAVAGPLVWIIGALATVVGTLATVVGFLLSPIGLVVVAIVGLGFVIFKFRNQIWNALKAIGGFFADTFSSIKNALVTWVQFIIDKWLGAVEWILRGAAKAFGWVPGIGPKLKTAAKEFEKFRDAVNAKLEGIKDKEVKITADWRNPYRPPRAGSGPQGVPVFHHGGVFRARRSGGEGLAILRDREEVLTPEQSRGRGGINIENLNFTTQKGDPKEFMAEFEWWWRTRGIA